MQFSVWKAHIARRSCKAQIEFGAFEWEEIEKYVQEKNKKMLSTRKTSNSRPKHEIDNFLQQHLVQQTNAKYPLFFKVDLNMDIDVLELSHLKDGLARIEKETSESKRPLTFWCIKVKNIHWLNKAFDNETNGSSEGQFVLIANQLLGKSPKGNTMISQIQKLTNPSETTMNPTKKKRFLTEYNKNSKSVLEDIESRNYEHLVIFQTQEDLKAVDPRLIVKLEKLKEKFEEKSKVAEAKRKKSKRNLTKKIRQIEKEDKLEAEELNKENQENEENEEEEEKQENVEENEIENENENVQNEIEYNAGFDFGNNSQPNSPTKQKICTNTTTTSINSYFE